MTNPQESTEPADRLAPADRFVLNIFTTALEGGIGYWSICTSKYRWQDAERTGDLSKMGVTVALTEATGTVGPVAWAWDGEGKAPRFKINADVIRKGLEVICAAKGPYYDPNGARTQCEAVPFLDKGTQRVVLNANRDLGDGYDEDGEVDAGVADVIVQVGLFGRVVFG
jgi:hypothetical protein